MNNMLLAFIFGPIEVVVPVFLTILGIVGVILVFALIMAKKEEKDILENGMVVYPETLFEDIEEMKECGNLRLYSKRIKKNLFVITASEISEEYKDGKFVSYASAKPVVLRAKTTLLNDFLKSVPEINYKSMIKRIGFQTRIEHNMVNNSNGFNNQENENDKEIVRIRFFFDYCSNNIFFYNAQDFIISWDGSLIPPEWQKDEKFMELNKKLCIEYDALFTNNPKEFTYKGFKNEQHKTEFMNLANEFVKYVEEKNNGKYEIINDYDFDD